MVYLANLPGNLYPTHYDLEEMIKQQSFAFVC